jgi:hypothetical protein
MGARSNIILAVERADANEWDTLLREVGSLFTTKVGAPQSVVIQDYETDLLQEMPYVESSLKPLVVAPQEIVTIYPSDRAAGCMQLAWEGRFRTIAISVWRTENLRDLVMEAWNVSGAIADVVLAGEELEVDEASLDDALSHARIPKNLDLCEEVIVRPRVRLASAESEPRIEHGGLHIVRQRGLR